MPGKTSFLPYLPFFCLLIVLGACRGKADSHSAPLAALSPKGAEIEALIDQYAAFGQFNGSVLVAEKGEVIFKKGYGFANMEWEVPNQPDTKHRLASVSKQFTALLILQLVAEGKLDLHAPIRTYLPKYPEGPGSKVTIHHLLTHSSGIPSYTDLPNYQEFMSEPHQPEDLLALFADSTLLFSPGERFEYSNSGYALLGIIIEKVSGLSYGEALQAQIFEPLGMKNSGLDDHKSLIPGRAKGYNKSGPTYHNASYIDMSVAYSAGGIYSSVEDLFLWDQALYTDKLLPETFRDQLFAEHILTGRTAYGYGWDIGKIQPGNAPEAIPAIFHSGVINGFTSLITRLPEDSSSIIFLSNAGSAPLNTMSRGICGILYDKPYNQPLQSVADELYKVILAKGSPEGEAFFQQNKAAEGFYLNESEMNLSGYAFLEAGQYEEARTIFRLNVEAHPRSGNVYDSYGEVLLLLGEEEKGIEAYRKSIELDPDNQHGIEVLKELGFGPE